MATGELPAELAVTPASGWRIGVRRSLSSILASGLMSSAGLVSGVLLARFLGPASRGELAAIVSWVGVLGMLADLGIGFAVSYHAGKDPQRVDVLFSQGLVTTLAARTAAVVLGAFILRDVPAVVAVGAPIAWVGLSAVIVGGPSGLVTSLLLGLGRVRLVNLLGVVTSWSYALVVAALSAAGERRVGAYVAAFALTQATSCAATVWAGRRRGNIRWSWSRRGWSEVLAYGLKTQVASLAAQTNLRLDQALMSLLVAPGQLGLYVTAVALASVMGPLYAGLNVALTPRVLHAPSPREASLRGIRTVAAAVTAGGLAAGALAAAAPWIISLLFGARFEAAAPMARVLLLGSLFQGANLLLGTTLRGLNRPGAPARAEGAGAAVTVVLLVLLLPRMGGMGAAIASVVSYATVAFLELAMAWRAGSLRARDLPAGGAAAPAPVARPEGGRLT